MDNENNANAIEALKTIALEGLKEQRRARRWGIFFKLLFWGYLLIIGAIFIMGLLGTNSDDSITASEITAVVDIKGVIMDEADASADLVIPSLRKAFANPKTKAVLLRINSPGGSPVQAGQINDEIRRLRTLHEDIPVYAVVSDICASGGYYIAVAADKIYADKASLVGSIGVRMDNFGFVEAMNKLGVERRLITAGENKGMLDPFLPENPKEVEHVKTLLNMTHQQFINVVKEGRGKRLKDNPDLFTGLIWTGEGAKELGLIDELGDERYVAREVVKAPTMVNFTSEKDFLDKIGEQLGTSVSQWFMQSSTPQPRMY
ncbi:MAG: signal peptide peptidase SppA [Thiofilum sp.]|uniref:signal peptide peptidase SppA n=1 Tax=Thiofilum sp. TaxID=2212733 RepID=UPI0025DF5620|nr:signal peptide peptidase SppA [Thiofilum sp.]MBK8454225.1 signal peptide peptidase SppA [Thiofilum sp.]